MALLPVADPRPDRRSHGAGKGSILWSLRTDCPRPSMPGGCGADPKAAWSRPGARLFSRFEDATPETMCDLLEDLVAVMDARAKTLAARASASTSRLPTHRTSSR